MVTDSENRLFVALSNDSPWGAVYWIFTRWWFSWMQKQGYLIWGTDVKRPTETTEYALEVTYLKELASDLGTTTPIAQAYGHIVKNRIMTHSIGIWRGLNRRLSCRGMDEAPEWYKADRVHAFISQPKRDFVVRRGKIVEATPPADSVFMVLARLWDSNDGQPEYVDPDTETVFKPRGVVHFWEWVRCDPTSKRLPNDYQSRYAERVV